MSVKLLRTLIAIEEHGSFCAAADAVFVTPAAISQQMKSLEKDLGVRIFDRSRRSPGLTQLGRALIAKARKVVAAYDAMVPSLDQDGGLAGELVLGAVPTTLAGLIPLTLSKLRRRHQNMHITVQPGLTRKLISDLQRGRIDAAVISRPQITPSGLEVQNIVEEKMQLLTAPGTEAEPVVDLLESKPFIRFNRDAVVGEIIENWLQMHKIRVKETMELESLESISSMVLANLGVSITPERCVAAPVSLPVNRIPLGDFGPKRTLGLLSRSDSQKRHVIERVSCALAESVKIGVMQPAKLMPEHEGYTDLK